MGRLYWGLKWNPDWNDVLVHFNLLGETNLQILSYGDVWKIILKSLFAFQGLPWRIKTSLENGKMKWICWTRAKHQVFGLFPKYYLGLSHDRIRYGFYWAENLLREALNTSFGQNLVIIIVRFTEAKQNQ